jgi:signal peptidase I
MTFNIKVRNISKTDIGYSLLAIYCLAVLAFFLIGTGVIWLRGWGPAKFRAFSMPAGSMMPSLEVGDYVLTAFYTWQEQKLERGDIVFFYKDHARSTIYVKRIVGLPGDNVQMIGGRLHINGQTLMRERLEDYPFIDHIGRRVSVPRYRETFPNGPSQIIIEAKSDKGYFDNTGAYSVPEGHVFLMGDNRDNSSDSRDVGSLGMVPVSNILGPPIVIYWSRDLYRIGSVPR